MNDITSIKPILRALMKLKCIVDEMATNVEERIKLKSKNNTNLHKKTWKRDLVNKDVKVKKAKKNDSR
ncbi:unnamed protein product [Absidia cylindrospora]